MQASDKQHKRFVKWLVTIITIAVIIGAAVSVYYFVLNKNAQTTDNSISAADDKSMLQQREFDDSVGEKAMNGNVKGVDEAYAEKINAATSNEEKAGLFLQKSIALSDHGEYKEGLSAALQSEKLYGSSDSAKDAIIQIVACYVNLKDYRNAKLYVEKLLATIHDGQSDYQYNKATYTTELKWLNSVLEQ